MPELTLLNSGPDRLPVARPASVAYVLKGYPRISELFIASEIRRLEQLGVALQLFVLKPADEALRHRVVDEIVARPQYLPDTTSLSSAPLFSWLRVNLPPFLPPLGRVIRRHPRGIASATAMAAAQSVRARQGWRPRKIYVKELLQAVALADELTHTPDVGLLHAHFAHGATTVAWFASAITGVPFSFTGHAKDIYQGSLNPAGLLARKMRAAEFVVTCTGANHEHLCEVAPGMAVHLMYHGLNVEFSRMLEAGADRIPPTRPRIVSVGRLVSKKGFDVLVQAVLLLVQQGVELDVVIAGESGDQEPDIRALVSDLGLDDIVTFAGMQSQEELFDLYRSSSVFVLACRVVGDGDRDGIPNVMMEAMATALPVVSTEVSGIPELVDHDTNGLLVPPESPRALADAVLRLIDDPNLAVKLGQAGRRTVFERFDGEVLAQSMADLFARTIHG